MPRRSPSPGPLLFPITVTCECRWQGIAADRAGALLLWQEHTDRVNHDLQPTNHLEEI